MICLVDSQMFCFEIAGSVGVNTIKKLPQKAVAGVASQFIFCSLLQQHTINLFSPILNTIIGPS